jgi:ABC-2 type transport system ATP-binding protein
LRSGRNHLRVLAAAGGIDDARVDEVLAMVDLTDAAGRKAGGYSLGMRQRLGLAAALLGDPQVLVLDEPGNGLDPQGIRWLRDLLRSFAAQGNAVLVSSHVLTEMAQLADDVVVINHGRLVRQAPVHALTTSARSLRVRTTEVARLAEALAREGIASRPHGADGLEVDGAEAARVGTLAFEAGVPVLGLVEDVTSLVGSLLELTEKREEVVAR